jgi:hypothetical protein
MRRCRESDQRGADQSESLPGHPVRRRRNEDGGKARYVGGGRGVDQIEERRHVDQLNIDQLSRSSPGGHFGPCCPSNSAIRPIVSAL